jgi:RNA polymerase sigma-70 factor (ECF subfamily)
MSTTVPALDVISNECTEEFEQIFREHSAWVYRTAYAVTGNAEDAEDVLQTIFLRLIRHEVPPNLKQNTRAYLYRAAVNVSLSVVKSRRSRELTGDADDFAASVHTVRSEASNETRERLLRMLEGMSESDPQAVELLILRYVHNYSDADIAKMMGKSRGVIAVRLFRARSRLRKLMRRGEHHETK